MVLAAAAATRHLRKQVSTFGTLPAATPAQMATCQSTGQLIVAKAVR